MKKDKVKKKKQKVVGVWVGNIIQFIDPSDPLKSRVLAECEPIKVKFYAQGVGFKHNIEWKFSPQINPNN